MKLSLMWDREGKAPAGWLRHIPVQWGDIEGAKGQYGFRRVEGWLAANRAPAFLGFEFSVANRSRGELLDLTPGFHKRSLALTAGGLAGQAPNYADRGWRAALYAAVEALAVRFRADPQVAGFFWGPGVDDEVNAVVDWPNAAWSQSLRAQLKAEDYYNFVVESTQVAVLAWAPTKVYLAAASAPGTPWGQRRKDVTVAALKWGAGYRCNGLDSDFGNAMGLGTQAGTGMYELAQQAQFCAFEMFSGGANQPDGRLYWSLLMARQWGADHVNVQAPWLGAAGRVAGLLPSCLAWLVFRDMEHAKLIWGETGQSGVPGPFSYGLWLENWPAQPVFRAQSFGFDRWSLTAPGAFGLATDLAAGAYEAEIWRPVAAAEPCRERLVVDVTDGVLTLPAGAYHRVDVLRRVKVDPPATLTLEERVLRLEQLHNL